MTEAYVAKSFTSVCVLLLCQADNRGAGGDDSVDIVFESSSISGATTSVSAPVFSKYTVAPAESNANRQSDSDEESHAGIIRHLDDSGFHKHWMPKVLEV